MPGTGVNPLRQAEGEMLIMPEKVQPALESPPPTQEQQESPVKPESPQFGKPPEKADKEPTVTIESKPEPKKKKKSGFLCCCIKPQTDEGEEGEQKREVNNQASNRDNVMNDDKESAKDKVNDASQGHDAGVKVKTVEEGNVSVKVTSVKPEEKQQADVEIMI